MLIELNTPAVHYDGACGFFEDEGGVGGEQFLYFLLIYFHYHSHWGKKLGSVASQSSPVATAKPPHPNSPNGGAHCGGQLANCLAACFGCLSSHEDPGQPAVDPQH